MHYQRFEPYFYRVLGAVLLNNGLKIGIFFVLPARVMGNRYMSKGRLVDLADSTVRRIPRLAVPIFVAVLFNYFLVQVDAFKWVPRLASRTWSTWSYFSDYSNVGQFINGWITLWFTLPPISPLFLTTYATGVLWTIPVIIQNSLSILITALVSREIPDARKRFGFYFLCGFFSWYANLLTYYFIAGLALADLDNKLKYRQWAAKGIPIVPSFLRGRSPRLDKFRIHGQIVGWILFLFGLTMQYLETNRAPGGRFSFWEHGILPNLHTAQPRVWTGDIDLTYYDPRITIFCMVMGMYVLCDLCKQFSTFFLLRFWNFVGRNAFSLFLLHGTIFWTWGAFLTLQLLKVGVAYWVTITIVFFTSYFILFLLCEIFTRTIDAMGVTASKAVWRWWSAALGRKD